MKNLKIHKDFTLNGKTFNSLKELLEFSKTLSLSTHSFLIDWFNDDDFIVVKTSGSTGKPTSIRLKKVYMVNSALATGEFFGLKKQTSTLLCLSTEYIAGKMMLVRALVLGWHLDIVDASSTPLNRITKTYDFCAMVPLQLNNSITELSKIKKLIVGGGTVSNDVLEKIKNLETKIYATYGMTETCTHIAIKNLNYVDDVNLSTVKRSVYYRTLPNINISKDKRGCLVINAPSILDKRIVTNDMVELISETEFKWLGRYDSIINSGGVKLIPEQIEYKLSALIDYRFFVAGISDNRLGEKLVLVIEDDVTLSDSDENRNSTEKLQNIILNEVKNLSTTTKYEIPKAVYFIPKFIETETKKINRIKTLKKLGL